MDYNHEAKKILYEHSEGVMSCCTTEFETNEEMLDFMIQECAFILTEKFLEGKYTPMQFNAIRNELSTILNQKFAPFIEVERAKQNAKEAEARLKAALAALT